MLTVGSVVALAIAIVLLVAGVDPVPTWFYVFAWYPTLVLLDALGTRRGARALVLAHPRRLLSVWAWSAPIWLFFEAANFRLDDWYYVFLPRPGIERWAGILLSFATVVPAILLGERLLAARGVGAGWRTPPLRVSAVDFNGALLLGAGHLVAALAWPRLFFPLIWGAMLLLCEPYVCRRRPELSLFADLARGEWGRVGRLLLAGLAIGLLWESLNYWARGKWIYTVPWLEQLKLYEMPLAGFVGFPVFALEAFAMYHALCAAGQALPLPPHPRAARTDGGWKARRTVGGLGAAAFCIAVLLGMERWTISSTVPRLEDLPGISEAAAEALRNARIRTPFELAAREPDALAARLALPPLTAARLVGVARLATLRGIGAEYAGLLQHVGVSDICRLARRSPGELWTGLHALLPRGRKRPTAAEVRVWVRAAEARCGPPFQPRRG